MTVTVTVVRHGQTDHNLQGIIQGSLDVPLNETGHLQAAAVGKVLSDIHFDAAFTSDLSRASQTARAIVSAQRRTNGQPPLKLIEQAELREREMGELTNTEGPMPRPLPPSVESSSAFVSRLMGWFNETIKPLTSIPNTKNVLVVSHGAAILTFFRQLTLPPSSGGLGFALAPGVGALQLCANTSIATLEINEDGSGRVTRFNDHQHLLQENGFDRPDDAVGLPIGPGS